MSLLERINAIHPSLITKQFAKQRDAFLKLEEPTQAQIDDFEKVFKDIEEKQAFRAKTEAEIVRHWKVYQNIVNDPRYPKDEPNFIRSEGRLKKGFASLKIEGDSVIEGKILTGTLKDVTSDALKTKWDQYLAAGPAATAAPAAKATKKRAAAAAPAATAAAPLTMDGMDDELKRLLKEEQFIHAIGVNPELSKAVDTLKELLAEGTNIEDATRAWSTIKENIPATTACRGDECNAKNTKLQDGLCAACLVSDVEERSNSIIDRFNVFKEEHDIEIAKRKRPQIEKDALKQRFNDISELRDEHDECYTTFAESHGSKGYAAYNAIYKKLDKILPTESLSKKKRRHFTVPDNDEIINSDESEAASSSGEGGGDSEYESDSSSSHSGAQMRRMRSKGTDHLEETLTFFAPIHAEIARLAAVYKENPANYAKEFEETKKNRMTRYKVVPVMISTGEDTGINFDEPFIFFTEEQAIKRGKEGCAKFPDTFTYRIVKL